MCARGCGFGGGGGTGETSAHVLRAFNLPHVVYLIPTSGTAGYFIAVDGVLERGGAFADHPRDPTIFFHRLHLTVAEALERAQALFPGRRVEVKGHAMQSRHGECVCLCALACVRLGSLLQPACALAQTAVFMRHRFVTIPT